VVAVQALLQQGGAAVETLTALKLQGQQFLWGGRECDEARRLQQQLLEVEQWVHQVRCAVRTPAAAAAAAAAGVGSAGSSLAVLCSS
jgi:hypothetical protein